ncbi:N-acetyltransferase [Morganella psychrotolerans]|uniref:N-acetyltransferase n=1 Tax=Morganella psychrotolerans TaxID=368603 RepID=A0A5M9RBC3_9GAMM|nr:acetyltransferase [Morganella psychrotolerans]KAA8716745.1 N-acetyltransferase [Morganella psychrotolerans]OBU08894.1 acetyltransferase [Morganella psychrotolerans]
MILYRLMTKEDCAQVTLLLQANAQSRQGGLLGEYPPGKVESMFTHSLHTVVAETGNTLVGVLFSFSPLAASVSPVTQQISQQFNELLENNWFYGPVCIDADYRGQGVLQSLYKTMCELNNGKPVAFINQDNVRSVQAHLKSGMREAGRFTCDGVPYLLMIGSK